SVYLTDKPAPSRSTRHGQHKQAAGLSQRHEVGDNALRKTLCCLALLYTLSQVSSFCWGSDCKTQRGGGGQDAGSAWELNGAEAQPSLARLSEISTGWPWKSQPQKQKVVPPLQPKSMHKPTSLPPSRGRPRHQCITQSCYPRNRENITAVSWTAFYP
ncbi:hypothetical protein AS27_02291, partial [Aptenodytes forsteri]